MTSKPLVLAVLKWGATFGVLAGLLIGAYGVHQAMQAELAGEVEKVKSPRRLKEGILDIGADNAERLGLADERPRALDWLPRLVLYGRVTENPQAAAEVRAPLAGTWRAAGTALGQKVKKGDTLGWLEARVGPEQRLDLGNKRSEARIRVLGGEEEVKLQQARVDSLKTVAAQAIIARGELDAALIQLAQAKNQLALARAAVELWDRALKDIDSGQVHADSPWKLPLISPVEGEVSEVAAHSGTALEAGAPIFKVVDFGRILVRLDIPPALLAKGRPTEVELLGPSSAPATLQGVLRPAHKDKLPPMLKVKLLGPAPKLDVPSQYVPYWYEAADNAASDIWRPGLAVQALVKQPGADPAAALSIPQDAVLYHEGRSLVYLELGPGKYQKREVQLLGREGGRWIVRQRQDHAVVGLAPNESVVTRNAQALLSEEFRGEADLD